MTGVLVLILIILFLGIMVNILQKDNKERYKKYNILYEEHDAIFMSGLPYVEGGKKATLTVNGKGFFIKIDGYEEIPIYSQDIIDVEIKTNEQITKEIGVGKLLVFGIFAFGMKNEKTIVKNYICVNCRISDKIQNVIVESKNTQQLLNTLRRFIK